MPERSRLIRRTVTVTTLVLALLFTAGIGAGAVRAAPQDKQGKDQLTSPSQVRWDLAFAVGVSIGLPCLAAGYAIGKVGAAALGAASERPELLTRSLIFVALGEGIAVFGLLVAVLVLIFRF